jgi:structural maintenance of chromosome 2
LIRDEKDHKEAHEQIVLLIKEHPWIKAEKVNFGKTGTEFDFSTKNPTEATTKLNTLMNQQQKLSKSINRKVLSMFDKAQKDYKELIDKKEIVGADKNKIEQVIKEVNDKKQAAIKNTWEKVNVDFGSIFSTLLPGSKAKLEPVDGSDVMGGLEVRVGFGSVWKESLTELSGGQRSILALSLILSLLLFKPAPMYILDEVDAALDPSHTQNIGRIVKNHFSNSQFIIISLKEGMFSNANVIFRTKFVNGQSDIVKDPTGIHAPVLINKENELPLEKEVPTRESEKSAPKKRKNKE